MHELVGRDAHAPAKPKKKGGPGMPDLQGVTAVSGRHDGI
jgi:hypothetical protein